MSVSHHFSALVFLTAVVAVSSMSIARAGKRGQRARSRTPARDQPSNVVAPRTEKLARDQPSNVVAPRTEKPARDSKSRTEKPLAAPWMQPLKKALNHGGTGRRRDRSEAKRKHVQIATVDPETGRPSVRTVVFRGFLAQKYVDSTDSREESCCLCFITDDRSAKFAHLGQGQKQGAPIECCWWLDEAGVQFRIAGRTLVGTARSEDAVLRSAVQEVWDRLGDSTKRQMYWPHPGAPKGDDMEVAVAAEEISLQSSHFVLLVVVPDGVDELHLGGGQKRILYGRGDKAAGDDGSCTLASLRSAVWSEEAVNP